MEGYSLDDALEYVKAYPGYVETLDILKEKKKRLILTGELSKLAQIEYMLGELSPWNYTEIEKKAKAIESDCMKLHVPKNGDLHTVNVHTLSDDFLTILKEAIKQGNSYAADVYAYYLAHNDGGYGECTEGDGMGSKLTEFLEEHASHLGKRACLLKTLNQSASDVFSPDVVRDIEPSCPEIRDMHDIRIFEADLMDLDTMGLISEDGDQLDRAAFVRLAERVNESSMAKYGIGYCYWNGYGVEKDEEKAKQWFRWAAAEGCCSAQNRLDEIEQSK